MRIVDEWSGGASPLRQDHYRVVEEEGEYRFEILGPEPDSWYEIACGHRVAREIAHWIMQEDRRRNILPLRKERA